MKHKKRLFVFSFVSFEFNLEDLLNLLSATRVQVDPNDGANLD